MGAKMALLASILLIGVVMALDLWRYYGDDPLVTRRQLVTRLFVGLWLQGVLAMVLIGDRVTAGLPPLQEMAYWGACLLSSFVPLFVALHEAGVVTRQYARRRAELFRGFFSSPPHGDRSRQN